MDLADPMLVKAIWKPEVFFPNAKEANFQFVTVPNVLIRIHPNGDILYILRLCVCLWNYQITFHAPRTWTEQCEMSKSKTRKYTYVYFLVLLLRIKADDATG